MPMYDQLTEWAGLGQVARAGQDVVAGWRIPGSMKVQLVEVGVPLAPRLIERVVMQSEAKPVLLTSRGPLYRLTEQADTDDQAERSSFGVEPVTGAVYFVMLDREAWFANSGVDCGSMSLTGTAVSSRPLSLSARRDLSSKTSVLLKTAAT
ncbi:SUKH-4 family immunity protein [Streptomyces sp. NPDC086783]|uniref:SUKH-4 family immunity protein n=1 Tax=Streptomyces sp. NPDC086783 TaxID=3365758 RepID=UPI0037F20BFE